MRAVWAARYLQLHKSPQSPASKIMNPNLVFVFLFSLYVEEAVVGYGIDSRNEVNFIHSIMLNISQEDPGSVSQVPGHLSDNPALLLQGTKRKLQIPDRDLRKLHQLLLTSSEFTLTATIKQERRNQGTIFSISNDKEKYLELYSSSRKSLLRFYYKSDTRTYSEDFNYEIDPERWYKMAVSVSGNHLVLYVDCEKVFERIIHKPDLSFDLKLFTAWLGQRNSYQSYFKGVLQDVSFVSGSHGYLSACPAVHRNCPTCGQYHQLLSTVEDLSKLVHNMEKKLASADERIAELESCSCTKECRLPTGEVYLDGDTWIQDCSDECACEGGNVKCIPLMCPTPSCSDPIQLEGECCKTCPEMLCFHGGIERYIGESWMASDCTNCTCFRDRETVCHPFDPSKCPPLPCPESQQKKDPEFPCCNVCEDHDFCTGHQCGENTQCIEMSRGYECLCLGGFQFSSDGVNCVDFDECLNGETNRCSDGTQCLNNFGSYSCVCLPGYSRMNDFMCEDIDECAEVDCDPFSDCVNTEGSFSCTCREGYEGNGFYCQIKCNATCLNGGLCTLENQCVCPSGFSGNHCENDVDECSSGLADCGRDAVCMNLPGSYYCSCMEGYSMDSGNLLQGTCSDVDECKLKLDTCASDMKCQNTDGGYSCLCKTSKSCSGRCVVGTQSFAHGSTFNHPDDTCSTCLCQNGVASCSKADCDCSKSGTSLLCCPQCQYKKQCLHQEKSVVYDDGQRWTYQCQDCHCDQGMVQCEEMSCKPLVDCHNSYMPSGECCARCVESEPCTLDQRDLNSASWCQSEQFYYRGGEKWQLVEDPCTNCICKDKGKVCCWYGGDCKAL